MKRHAVIVAAAVSLAFAGQALAQQVAVEIAPTMRTTIKEYVVKENVPSVTLTERAAVGVTLPAEVKLHPVPQAWGPSVSTYHYVYTDNNVVLVEPSSRRVVQIID